MWIASGAQLLAYDHSGNVVYDTSGLEWGSDSAPAIADLGNGGLSVITLDQADQQANRWTVRAYPIPGTSRMHTGAWPVFHGNSELSGAQAPQASMNSLSSTQGSTGFTVSWGLDSNSVGASSYRLWVRDHNSSRWSLYATTAATSMTVYGTPGHTYSFAVEASARGATMDMSFVNGVATTTVSNSAGWSTPFHEMYGADGHGLLDPGSSAPLSTGQYWPDWDIIRGVALNSSGQGGYLLDGWGGLHAFGGAPAVQTSGYWPGWDIARGVVLRSDGHSGYVLDGWGGLHPFGTSGDIPPHVTGSYWTGWDIAKDVVLRSDGQSGYVLDGWGGIHPFGVGGDVPPRPTDSSYWPGINIARRFTLDPHGDGGYMVDGWGGIHAFGVGSGAPPANAHGTAYWKGWDIARGIAYIPGSSTQGYVVDAWGGFHPFGGAPSVLSAGYIVGGVVRDLAIS